MRGGGDGGHYLSSYLPGAGLISPFRFYQLMLFGGGGGGCEDRSCSGCCLFVGIINEMGGWFFKEGGVVSEWVGSF